MMGSGGNATFGKLSVALLALGACADASNVESSWAGPGQSPADSGSADSGGDEGNGPSDGGDAEIDSAVTESGSPSDADIADIAAPPDAADLPPMPTQSFLIGYNEAWWGGQFGTDYTTAWDLAYVQSTMDGIAGAGGHLVRVWLWEVPQGITLGPAPPQTQSVSPQFLANVDAMLWEARKRGLWVYVTLLDGNTIKAIAEPLHTYGVNLLNNVAGEQDAFHTNALAPLLDVLDKHQDNVFAIDIINEIQAAYKSGLFADAVNGPKAFLLSAASFIKAKSPWVKVTSSAGWPDDLFKTGGQYDIANCSCRTPTIQDQPLETGHGVRSNGAGRRMGRCDQRRSGDIRQSSVARRLRLAPRTDRTERPPSSAYRRAR